jgi:hypothetical protein
MDMNTAIGAPTYRPHGGLRKHQVAILAGLVALAAAVVAVVAVIATPWSDGGSAASAGRSRAIEPFSTPAMIVYLVGSEAQAQALIDERTATAAAVELDGIAPTPYEVLVAGTISDESIALSTLAEMRSRWDRAGATGLVVEDLR